MVKEKTARAVIVLNKQQNQYLVTIKRRKFKEGKCIKEYYTLPGGHIDDGENFEEALLRELEEELSISAKIDKDLIHIYNKDLKRDEKFYKCSIISGNIKKGNGPEWTCPNIDKYGSYDIEFINVKNIKAINILPIEVKNILIKEYEK